MGDLFGLGDSDRMVRPLRVYLGIVWGDGRKSGVPTRTPRTGVLQLSLGWGPLGDDKLTSGLDKSLIRIGSLDRRRAYRGSLNTNWTSSNLHSVGVSSTIARQCKANIRINTLQMKPMRTLLRHTHDRINRVPELHDMLTHCQQRAAFRQDTYGLVDCTIRR